MMSGQQPERREATRIHMTDHGVIGRADHLDRSPRPLPLGDAAHLVMVEINS